MKYSKEVLKRFFKDFNIPIDIYEEPYCSYLVSLYDEYYGLSDKFKMLDKEIAKFKNENDFLEYQYQIRNEIIEKTKEQPIYYNDYLETNMDMFKVANNYSEKDIYKETNVGKTFLSIDLKKANFQALKFFNRELVFGADTYEEYISKFTDSEYFKSSKKLRQIIFGNMNPKRQVKIEKYIMNKILILLTTNILHEESIVSFSNDEIVFDYNTSFDKTWNDDCINAWHVSHANLIKNICKSFLGIDVRVEIFKLEQIENKPYYVKEFIVGDKKYELKCVPKIYFPQVFKKYNGLEVNEKDLMFWFEGQLCTFMKPLF